MALSNLYIGGQRVPPNLWVSAEKDWLMKSSQETFDLAAVSSNLDKLKNQALAAFGPTAGRLEFYDYLSAAYKWVMIWKKANRIGRLRKLVAQHQELETLRLNADVFNLVIAATSPRSKKTNSKFAIALANAQKANVPPRDLQPFLAGIGGPTALSTHLPAWIVKNKYRKFKKGAK
jgi:hypothetical protein